MITKRVKDTIVSAPPPKSVKLSFKTDDGGYELVEYELSLAEAVVLHKALASAIVTMGGTL